MLYRKANDVTLHSGLWQMEMKRITVGSILHIHEHFWVENVIM